MHVLLVYAPNSGESRLQFRVVDWEPSMRKLIAGLQRTGKPVLYQGDLNVAHVRALDHWGTTDSQFGSYKQCGRTREEMAAMGTLLDECELVDGFRWVLPSLWKGNDEIRNETLSFAHRSL